MTRKPIRTCVVGGFLGAGKTTFVMERLQREGERVAVLVNEFGTLGIDGDLIRARGGLAVVELPGGCICCSQKEGLVQTIRRIASDIEPELLLIEPSGVAETSELLQVLADRALSGSIRLDAVITVIDAETFLQFSEPEAFGLFFLDQVQNADLVLVNKADLVDERTLHAVEERISRLAPAALCVRTSFCRLAAPLPQAPQRERTPSPRVPLGMESVSLTPPPLPPEALERLLAEIASGSFGSVLRGKGFLQVPGRGTVHLQIASGRGVLEDLPAPVCPRLTLIGTGLAPERLASYLNIYR